MVNEFRPSSHEEFAERIRCNEARRQQDMNRYHSRPQVYDAKKADVRRRIDEILEQLEKDGPA